MGAEQDDPPRPAGATGGGRASSSAPSDKEANALAAHAVLAAHASAAKAVFYQSGALPPPPASAPAAAAAAAAAEAGAAPLSFAQSRVAVMAAVHNTRRAAILRSLTQEVRNLGAPRERRLAASRAPQARPLRAARRASTRASLFSIAPKAHHCGVSFGTLAAQSQLPRRPQGPRRPGWAW